MITQQQIKAILPTAPDTAIANIMPFVIPALTKYNITTPQRIGAFFAQIGEESNNLKAVKEYASGTEYEGRKDLGNIMPGDGVKFKGRGFIQITGRNGYKAVSHALYGNECLLVTPELLESPSAAINSACYFWEKMKNINPVCDMPETWIKPGAHGYTKFQWITILVNGGTNGYTDRLANYTRARAVLAF